MRAKIEIYAYKLKPNFCTLQVYKRSIFKARSHIVINQLAKSIR